MVFNREAVPIEILTLDFETFNAFAIKRHTSAFAAPSEGGADIFILGLPSKTPA